MAGAIFKEGFDGGLHIKFTAVKDSGTGEVVAGYGAVNEDWARLSNGKEVRVVAHPETYYDPLTRSVKGGGEAVIELREGEEVKSFRLHERHENSFLGLRHEGDAYETV